MINAPMFLLEAKKCHFYSFLFDSGTHLYLPDPDALIETLKTELHGFKAAIRILNHRQLAILRKLVFNQCFQGSSSIISIRLYKYGCGPKNSKNNLLVKDYNKFKPVVA